MALFCTFLFGSLCLSPPLGETSIHYSNAGLGDVLQVRIKDWQIGTARTDVVESLDKAKLASACRDEACAYYWRRCEVTSCSFYYGVPDGDGRITAQQLSVKAESPIGLAEALLHLAVKVTDDKMVPLSEMDKEAQGGQPPLCRGIPSPGCS